jgi:hypothetical protein
LRIEGVGGGEKKRRKRRENMEAWESGTYYISNPELGQ